MSVPTTATATNESRQAFEPLIGCEAAATVHSVTRHHRILFLRGEVVRYFLFQKQPPHAYTPVAGLDQLTSGPFGHIRHVARSRLYDQGRRLRYPQSSGDRDRGSRLYFFRADRKRCTGGPRRNGYARWHSTTAPPAGAGRFSVAVPVEELPPVSMVRFKEMELINDAMV